MDALFVILTVKSDSRHHTERTFECYQTQKICGHFLEISQVYKPLKNISLKVTLGNYVGLVAN